MKLRYIFFIIFVFVVKITTNGQVNTEDYNTLKLKHFSISDGLSQSSVLAIHQDRDGFLWFGTRDGLNKYNGKSFQVFRHSNQDSTSLSHSLIKCVIEDSKGDLWVGTVDGLNKYIPENDAFIRFYYNTNKLNYENNEIWDIVEASEGYLWLATSMGLKKFNTKTNEFVDYPYPRQGSYILKKPIRALLWVETTKQLWVKTTEDIVVFNVHKNTIKRYQYPENSPKELNKNNVSVFYQDKRGQIWLGFKNGLAILNPKTDKFEFFKSKYLKKAKINIKNVRSIVEDNVGNLWVGTYKGLYIYSNNKDVFFHHLHDENNPNSLSQNSIYTIYEDNRGDVWIGTYAGGVNYFDRSFDVFKHFSAGISNKKLNYSVVSSLVEDQNNNLWVGTEGGGVNVYNVKTRAFNYLTHEPNNSNSISANNVKAMIQDRKGNFWIGTHDEGLNFLNPHKKPYKFKKYKNNPKDENSLSDNRIIALQEDTENNIWIGTSGGGLNVLNTTTNLIKKVDTEELTGKIIYTISQSLSKDTLFVGGDKGLCKVNVKTMSVVPIHYLGSEMAKQSARAVLSIYQSDENNIWVGTEGDGLYCYNFHRRESTKFGTLQGLPNDIVYGILPDNQENIWLSTNKGLCRLNLNTFNVKNFNELDGLQSNEFNYGAYLKNRKGELIFGGAKGFNIFNPENIKENTYIPPVLITKININNRKIINITDNVNEIVLKHNQNVFSLDFFALSYSQPNKNQYAYKLEGFDEEWNFIGNKNSATYTNLDAGNYTFKVKASNNDGLWNEEGDSIKVKVLPAPWFTWWAYLIYIGIIIILLYQIRKYSLIRIQERNELKQERLEKERIAEVNKMKLQLFTNISHDFRTPLTLIIGPLERLLKKDYSKTFIKEQHEIMYRNASILMELINQLLDFRKNEAGKLKIKASELNLVSFIKDIKQSFDELAREKDIIFNFSFKEEKIKVWLDKTQVKKVVFNLLSNAFKFTPKGGEITLRISIREKVYKGVVKKYATIEVEDNGKGIPKKNIKYIFDRYYQLGERSGTGIGLALVKNLVELHKGFVKVKSKKNVGTTFKVFFPLGKNHLSKDQISKKNIEDDTCNVKKTVYVDKEIMSLDTNNLFKLKEIDKNLSSILIVEDNLDVRKFIRTIFEDTYNIFEAPNGKKAIKLAKNNAIDLIISDIMMPEMDGIELCDKIKTNIKTSHIPILLLTAKTSKEYKKVGFQTGADAYITKPFDSKILELRVHNLISSRKKLIDKFKKDLILQPKELTVTSADELFLKKAIEYVEANISNSNYTIKNFVIEMGVSRSVLYRKLKALTGQSISEFIKTIKLKRAAQLIEQTSMTISEVAFELGFNDLKNFRESFKKVFHKLPSEYKKSK
ncbi:response regulator [Seonamhaeicola sp. NFXS20]|uniref:hybrid sensor histidine kinase/response regulator transcription factor n=1 Tax=Seonamhaeicola sp. NFXS20 TaxID=2816959 RepID=UPI003B8BAD9A